MDPAADSLERLVPLGLGADDVTGHEALRIGQERYAFAARHVRAGRALDVACGVGYGTRQLSDARADVTEVIGIDVSPEAIRYAETHYANERTRFGVSDAMRLEDEQGFDSIVSIETIEHLPDPQGFVALLAGLLRPGGWLVASVPITPSVDANPHHLHDFTASSFRRLFAPHGLQEMAHLIQDQPFGLRTVLARDEPRLADMRTNLPGWYLAHPGSFARRVWSTIRYGLKNRYLTVAWRARP